MSDGRSSPTSVIVLGGASSGLEVEMRRLFVLGRVTAGPSSCYGSLLPSAKSNLVRPGKHCIALLQR